MPRSLLNAVVVPAICVVWAVSPAPVGSREKAPDKPRLGVATVELADGLKTKVTANTLTDLLVKHARVSPAYKEVELAGEQLQQLTREARRDLALGRVPPSLKVNNPAPSAPELLLVATASRVDEVTVMTARLVDRRNLKILRTAEVRGRGKAGDLLDFPPDLIAQLTGGKGGGRLSISLQMHVDVDGPVKLLGATDKPLQNAKLKFARKFSGYELSADPKSEKVSTSPKGWELDWKLTERTEVKVTIIRNKDHLIEPDLSDEKGSRVALAYNFGGENVKETYSIVVSPWRRQEVRIDAEKLRMLVP